MQTSGVGGHERRSSIHPHANGDGDGAAAEIGGKRERARLGVDVGDAFGVEVAELSNELPVDVYLVGVIHVLRHADS